MKTKTPGGRRFAACLLPFCAAFAVSCLVSLFPACVMAQESGEASPFSARLAYPPAFDPDAVSLPSPGGAETGNARMSAPAFVKETDGADEWTMQFELRGSPVTEIHGNAGRNGSLGGLVRGRFRF